MTIGMRIPQRHHFGVRAASALGVALTKNSTVGVSDDAADSGVGGGEEQALSSLLQGEY
jgi:hypothetical protein